MQGREVGQCTHTHPGYYPIEEHLPNQADEWAMPPQFYPYAQYTSQPEGY